MSGSAGDGERTHDPTPRRLEQARERGDVPVSREGSAVGILAASLLGIVLAGPPAARQMTEVLRPLLEQPDSFGDLTAKGWRMAGAAALRGIGIGVAPFLLLALAGALLPLVLQGSVVVVPSRIAPKLGNLSPARGLRRIVGVRPLVEFAKALAKALAVGAACWTVAAGLFRQAPALVAVDLAAAPGLIRDSLASLLLAAVLVGAVVAGIDVPWQHWSWRRRQRMTLQELREEMRASEGDPQIKARQRRLRRRRAQRRMMQEVPKASVVVANPTHVAVALRYRRGEDAAPVVVAKGQDLVALRIREVAREAGVAVVEDKPLARALHASAEIGEMIPPAHFEAVARIIGMIWARNSQAEAGRR